MSPIIATTFCPGASPLPAGAASTVPAASIPGTRGKLTPTLRPSRSFSSERLRPNASTRMRTQPSRSGGSGSVVSRRLPTGPGAESRTARMVAGEDVMGLPSSQRSHKVVRRWSTCCRRGFIPSPRPPATSRQHQEGAELGLMDCDRARPGRSRPDGAPAQLLGGKMTSAWTPAGVLDSAGPIPGYFDSPWPAECGGPRRQRIPRSAGLGVGKATGLRQRSRTNGEWNVLVVLRAPGEMYLQYTNHLTNPEKYGQVELIDATSLEAVRRSPRLPTGGHTWCTALVAHENGYLYLTSGNRCVKLDPDCAVVAEAMLPRDSAYNGLLVAADGRLIMKNIERDAGQLTTLTVLDPDRLEQTGPETLVPENSMGSTGTVAR